MTIFKAWKHNGKELEGSNDATERIPHPLVSLIPFVVLAVTLTFIVRCFGADSLAGASQVALLFSASLAATIAMVFYRTPFSKLENAISANIKTIGSAIIILLLIGAIAGSWMISGIVPTMIYYGLQVISPAIFLFAVCLICALVAIMTGSSWSTIATIGVALIGIGMALGYSTGWTAGAIISGAYFGDKISPLSDTTVLASSTNEVPLFEHIRYMLITTVPSMSIACIVFLIASLTHDNNSIATSEEFSTALQSSFNISPWLLLVPALTLVLIIKRAPALLILFISALVAGIAALIAQPETVAGIGGAEGPACSADYFKGILITFYGDTSVNTGSEVLDSLVQTHGMNGMLSTIFLIVCAASFGGVMAGSGMIASITNALTRKISGRTATVGATVSTGIFSNMITGDQFLSIILSSSLFKKLYKDKGFEARLLSRSVEDSATITSVLIPWNSCGMTQSTVLKVPTLDYLPYCIFNLLSPVVSVIVAATGYRIFKLRTNTEKNNNNI
ncbi:MAG: sodium:proton antiporter [Bacteroidales bacterium]|nr:sodium:proton antiporter [Bacteroidales bacterium]